MSMHGSHEERHNVRAEEENQAERSESSSDRKGIPREEPEDTRQDEARNASEKDEEQQGGEPKA
jgi:hypothetical protein